MSSGAKYTTLAAWPLAICRGLEQLGIDPDPLLKQAGLNREDFMSHPDGRVDVRQMTQFWELAKQVSGNEAFGLYVARFVQPMHFRALGLLMLTTDNLEHALIKAGQYSSMVSNSVLIRLEQTPDLIGFCIEQFPDVEISDLAVDGFLATLVSFIRQLGAESGFLDSVTLNRAAPKSKQPWIDCFEHDVEFDAQQNSIWLKRSCLKQAIVGGDPKMASFNEAVVKEYVQKLQGESYSNKVKHLILAQLEKEEPSFANIAKQLTITERSLRRRLQDEDTSYRELLQHCRMEMAEYYLAHTEFSLTEVALRVGFADSSGFSKAFSRQYKITPTEYRKQSS